MKALKIAKKIDEYVRDYGCSNGTINLLDDLIDELEALKNRSCESCKHWNNNCFNLTVNTTGFCMYYGISNGDFEEDMKNVFCCNKWEQK